MASQATVDALHALRKILAECGENEFASMIEEATSGSPGALIQFLESNELWGGAGSVADQAAYDTDRTVRRQVEAALIQLGKEQSKDGVLNPRTHSWVHAFSERQKQGN